MHAATTRTFAGYVTLPETRLTVAADLTAPAERIETRTVGEWRRMALPELNKRPAIFIIG